MKKPPDPPEPPGDGGGDGSDDEEGETDSRKRNKKSKKTTPLPTSIGKEAATIKMMKLPLPGKIRSFKTKFYSKVATASAKPKAAMLWLLEVEDPDITDEELVSDNRFETLKMKMADALLESAELIAASSKADPNLELSDELLLYAEQQQLGKQMPDGRFMLRTIIRLRATDAEKGHMYSQRDLMKIKIEGSGVAAVKAFSVKWRFCLQGMRKEEVPSEVLKRNMLEEIMENREEFKVEWTRYDKLPSTHADRSYPSTSGLASRSTSSGTVRSRIVLESLKDRVNLLQLQELPRPRAS